MIGPKAEILKRTSKTQFEVAPFVFVKVLYLFNKNFSIESRMGQKFFHSKYFFGKKFLQLQTTENFLKEKIGHFFLGKEKKLLFNQVLFVKISSYCRNHKARSLFIDSTRREDTKLY